MMKKKWYPIIIAVLLVLLYVLQLTSKTIAPDVESFRHYTHLVLTKHAKCRMDCREINEREIRDIIATGTVNRNKSGFDKAHNDSTYALEGYTYQKQHVRIVVAPKNKDLVVITVIDLDKEWQCDCN